MNILPRNDRIVVRRHPPKQQKGSIVIPDAASEKSQRGTILAVGPKCDTVKPGMEVLFSSKWNDLARDRFDDLPVGADPYIHLVQEADVLAILG